MLLAADTHVHVYPSYDASAALSSARSRLVTQTGQVPETAPALLLTERFDCTFFTSLAHSNQPAPTGWRVEPTPEPAALLLRDTAAGEAPLWLFAGRQVVTADGIELLALLTTATPPDRQPTDTTLAAIRDSGGLPVLAWAPGKWFGRRGAVIARLIETADPTTTPLLIGDTSLRPLGWGEPALFARARARGLPVIAGSDPLPFAADADAAGRYGLTLDGFDPDRPVASVRAALVNDAFHTIGRRNPPWTMLRRWLANERARRSAT
jgi:hypothetical protein